jgi:hypothetical protein
MLITWNVGKIKDFFVFRSNHVPSTGALTGPLAQLPIRHNLAFTKDGIGLAMRRLSQPLPGTGMIAEYAELGDFGIRIHMKYNPNTLAQEFSIGVLYGCSVLRPDWVVPLKIGSVPLMYTPQIEGDKALFQLRVQHCNCGLPMLDIPVAYRNVCWVHDLFPRVSDEGLEAQMRRANIRFVSGSLDVNNKPICQQCEADGKSEFLCDLCQKVKPSSKRKERFGYPPEFLCTLAAETARLRQEIEDLKPPLRSDRVCPKCREQFRVPVSTVDVKAREAVMGREATAIVTDMVKTMRCSDCEMLVGTQHRPGCHRQGLVTETSDYRDRHDWKFGEASVTCVRCGVARTQANDAEVCNG